MDPTFFFFFAYLLFFGANNLLLAPSKTKNIFSSKFDENLHGETRGNSKTSCEDGFLKKLMVKELWTKNCPKIAKFAKTQILVNFEQFFANNS